MAEHTAKIQHQTGCRQGNVHRLREQRVYQVAVADSLGGMARYIQRSIQMPQQQKRQEGEVPRKNIEESQRQVKTSTGEERYDQHREPIWAIQERGNSAGDPPGFGRCERQAAAGCLNRTGTRQEAICESIANPHLYQMGNYEGYRRSLRWWVALQGGVPYGRMLAAIGARESGQ